MAFAFFQNPDDYCFSHITCENGLSQNNVKAIVQDRYGFIWLGTKNGLDRFDGKTMVRKVCEDRKAQKEGRDISALCAGRNGALWVGTGNGVFCYDPESDRFVYLEAKTKEGIRINSWVLNIVEDEDGSVWIVVPEQGVFRYVRGKLQLYKVVEGKQMQECPVSHLLVRRNGEVWLSTWGAGLFRYDKSSNRFVRLAMGEDGGFWDGKKMVMMCEYDGSVVLGTHEGRLFKYVPGDLVPKEMECPGLPCAKGNGMSRVTGYLYPLPLCCRWQALGRDVQRHIRSGRADGEFCVPDSQRRERTKPVGQCGLCVLCR